MKVGELKKAHMISLCPAVNTKAGLLAYLNSKTFPLLITVVENRINSHLARGLQLRG